MEQTKYQTRKARSMEMLKISKEEDLDCSSDTEAKRILMKMDKEDIIDRYFYRYNKLLKFIFIFGIICLILGGIFGYNSHTYSKDVKQLGESICEEEYGMDYESYIDNTLKCKPFTESYDGIKIEIPKTQTTPTP